MGNLINTAFTTLQIFRIKTSKDALPRDLLIRHYTFADDKEASRFSPKNIYSTSSIYSKKRKARKANGLLFNVSFTAEVVVGDADHVQGSAKSQIKDIFKRNLRDKGGEEYVTFDASRDGKFKALFFKFRNRGDSGGTAEFGCVNVQ